MGNNPVNRTGYTEDMECGTSLARRIPSSSNSAFCDSCGIWKHDVVRTGTQSNCSTCSDHE